MKAAYIDGHGGNEVVHVGERPLPERAHGDVRLRLHAATLNRVDLYMRDSGAGITHRIPQIMGLDGAGLVDEVDADEPQLRVGQRVCERVRAADIVHAASAEGRMTVSIGVAAMQADDADAEQMLRRADDAPYRAKAAGRNRVSD